MKLNHINGLMMKCSSCNSELPDNLKFCPSCGAIFEALATSIQSNIKNQAPAPRVTNNNLIQNNIQINYIGDPAGFWLRLAAHLIDTIILSLVSAIVGIIYGYTNLTGQLILYIIFAPWIYEAGMISSKMKGTIGKKIVNIKVLNDHGEQLTFASATARYWLKALLWLVTLGIITITSLFRKDKKTGYDILLNTNVYRN
jgi:uncharacterized RDD family membrane protein YckC